MAVGLGTGDPVLRFLPDIRKVRYTTNMIESIDYQLRKISKTRGDREMAIAVVDTRPTVTDGAKVVIDEQKLLKCPGASRGAARLPVGDQDSCSGAVLGGGTVGLVGESPAPGCAGRMRLAWATLSGDARSR